MQQLHECPLCETSKDTATEIYSHLMTHHRKSTISRRLIESEPEMED